MLNNIQKFNTVKFISKAKNEKFLYNRNIEVKAVAKKNVSKKAITEAALEILHEKGIAALTMRNIAAKLKVQAPALYWYIKNKQELLQLIGEYISSQIIFPKKKNNWQEEMTELALEIRKVLLSVPNGAEIMMDTLPITKNRLQLINKTFEIFYRAQFPEHKIFTAVLAINNYVTTYVLDEQRQLQMVKMMGEEEIHKQFSAAIRQMPADEIPYVYRHMLKQEGIINTETNFLAGLTIILKGIEGGIKEEK